MRYRVNVGLDYGDRRTEPGAIVDDLPVSSIPWLLEQGAIEAVVERSPKAAAEDEP